LYYENLITRRTTTTTTVTFIAVGDLCVGPATVTFIAVGDLCVGPTMKLMDCTLWLVLLVNKCIEVNFLYSRHLCTVDHSLWCSNFSVI